ncbi:RidA family protein [Azovibrio restrictus]|uniref:RidA family protein n=1 Tax=Azovibrio restrictus TaxID=146938 RepID=UPI0026EC0ED6|nr:RidA family protein [Azovibrio restrictus]MDD3483499.1 RidA family protein [Azovibrio restrictus]
MKIQRHGTTRRYSDTVSHAGTVYLVEVPQSTGADIHTQTREVLESLERLLTQAGSDKSRLLLATIYLRDMEDYEAMNEQWDNWIPDGCAPARACIQARLAHPGYRLEVVLTAASIEDTPGK